MSLISQQDRKTAIEALDFYLFNKKFDLTEEKRMELNALINWIKLEYNKNEDKSLVLQRYESMALDSYRRLKTHS
jgi:hypothetical protein